MSKKTDELAVSAITGVDVSQDEKGVTSGKTSVFLGSFPFGSPYFARCAVGNLHSDFSSENISASSSMVLSGYFATNPYFKRKRRLWASL